MERVSVDWEGEEEGLEEEWGEGIGGGEVVVVEFNLHMMTTVVLGVKGWSTNISSLLTDFSRYTNSKGNEQITRSTFKTMSSIYRSSHSGDNGIQKYKTFSLYSSPSPPPNVKKNGEKFSSFLLSFFFVICLAVLT